MDDLISRQALRLIESDSDAYPEVWNHDYERGFCDAIIRALGLPSAQRWMPCSERLPEKNGRYLVTRGLRTAGALWNRVYIVNYSDLMGLRKNRIFWQGNVGKNDFERIDDVIAWMPLPEPYKEGQDDKNDNKM